MSIKSDKFSGGFTFAELLIALVVTGILLAAVATAFNASIINYQENEDIFRTHGLHNLDIGTVQGTDG